MTGIRLITSAAYLDQELAAEFGEIPPSFLPIGVSRLYEAQLTKFGDGPPVYLTLPEHYVAPTHDLKRLEQLGVHVLFVPEGLRLGESIVYALNLIESNVGPVTILHGDTLIGEISQEFSDMIAFKEKGDDYSWAALTIEDGKVSSVETVFSWSDQDQNRPVACGYFHFSSSSALIQAITLARGDFPAALNLYVKKHPVRAQTVRTWHDFGHIQTYFRSRRSITTERFFNTLHIDEVSVKKASADNNKMRAEINWFASIPADLLPYSARLLDHGSSSESTFYKTEYQYAPTLSELFVFGSIGKSAWSKILRSSHDFLDACFRITGPNSANQALTTLALEKTLTRLSQFSEQTGFNLDQDIQFAGKRLPSLRRIATDTMSSIDLGPDRPATVMHGDFCFSNILYNSRSARISVIDPRGYVTSDEFSIYGDRRYDIAKLTHSIFGYYDLIIAGRYQLDQTDKYNMSLSFDVTSHHRWLQDALAEMQVGGIGAGNKTIKAITICLFLSMLPLHADRADRQAAFVANAIRLYTAL